MNALTVLVLLLFAIFLALSLLVWSALNVRRRGRELAEPETRQTIEPRARPVVRDPSASVATGVAKASAARPVREPEQPPIWRPEPGTFNPSEQTPGRAGRVAPEQRRHTPQSLTAEENKSAQQPKANRAPKVVVTEAEVPKATVTPTKLERDAFDRFLEAENDRR